MELLRLMLVDDESLILKGLKETYDWESMGFQIVGTALDGDIALKLLEDTKPDIIMTDIRMKRMSGLELMEEVRKQKKEIEFVVLSAYKDFEYAQTAIKNGALHYLLKPLDEEELSETMQEIHKSCLEKIKRRENYASWKRLLMKDKDNFLQIMTRKYLDEGFTEEKLTEIYSGLEMDNYLCRSYIAVCADLESSCLVTQREEEYNEKRHVLGMLLQNALKEKYDMQVFSMPDGCQVYLLFLAERMDGVSIRAILRETEKKLGSVIVSSISGCYESLAGMKQAYREALEIYEVACESGASGLSFQKQEGGTAKPQYSLDIEGQLLHSIRINDEEQMKAACERFVYTLPDDEVGKLYLHRLMVRVEFALGETENLPENIRKLFENFYSSQHRFQLTKMIDLAYKLLKEIIRQRRDTVSRASETVFRNYIKEVMEYIEGHLSDEELSITQIAEQIHLNPVYFGRFFKTVYGISLKRYILKLRIEKAKLLLLEGNCNVTEVGSRVGISNSSYFTKLFKEGTGKLPSEYLKKDNSYEG